MLTKVLFGIEIVLGLIVIVSVLMQKSKADALSGLIQGTTKDTFFSKNKARTKEVVLVRLTVLFSFLFAVNTIIVNIVK